MSLPYVGKMIQSARNMAKGSTEADEKRWSFQDAMDDSIGNGKKSFRRRWRW